MKNKDLNKEILKSEINLSQLIEYFRKKILTDDCTIMCYRHFLIDLESITRNILLMKDFILYISIENDNTYIDSEFNFIKRYAKSDYIYELQYNHSKGLFILNRISNN